MTGDDKAAQQRPSRAVAMEADRWLARLHSPDCGAEDRRRFQDWLARHPTHWQAYNQAEQLWSAAAQEQDPDMVAMADAVLLRAKHRRQRGPRRGRLMGWAASVLVVVGGGWGLLQSGWMAPEPPAAMYSTAIGEIRAFTLPDGSVVTLNTDTVLQVRMGAHARTVALQRGEAQFDVAPDQQRPFTVDTPLTQITALGTVFQVRNTKTSTEVSLLEGRVQVAPVEAGWGARQDLEPGDRLEAKAGVPWQRTRVDVEAAQAWLSGRLVFDGIPLRQAVEEFNRYSQRQLRIDDPAIGDIPIQGIFNAGDTDSIVLALQYAYPLSADDRGTEVGLRHR
ncbi:Putative transmembrane sensor [plant metagenome]|uniref:Transmembrane sensor n=2 Tax=plant metagenome TaxID=1297885 RepID=A0A484XFB9_9ZZZZ